jgi:diguanylate cyclase (GGDEF)-like protein/PAS domain S-box-containing protein
MDKVVQFYILIVNRREHLVNKSTQSQNAPRYSLIDNFKQNSAKAKSIKIVAIYLIFGCAWILGTDLLSNTIFTNIPQVYLASIIKGLFFVLLTAVIIYLLIYPPLKKSVDSEKELQGINQALKESNQSYVTLYEELGEKQSLLKSLIDSTEDWIFYKDAEGVYLGCNEAYEKHTGLTEEALIGRTAREVFDSTTANRIEALDHKLVAERLPQKYEQAVINSDGEEVIVEIIKTPFLDKSNNILGIICVGRDITERKQREENIHFISRHDALTGLYNRVYFEEERVKIDSEENLPISVIVCDVDGLKLVNDAFGHVAGDNLLIAASEILKNYCREQDIAIRTGGDEFSVFFPGTSNEDIEIIFNKINNQAKNKQIQTPEGLQFTSISMGYATKETQGQSLDGIILKAEEYMYRRKLLARKGSHSILMKSIKTTLHEKSYETQEHCSRMSELARKLGHALNVPNQDLDILELAASLHDVGKISIDLSILQKTEKLTEQDWEVLKKHPEVGWRITQAIPELNPISDIILYHHEKWDGTGYPRGLSGVEIPLMARIISIVDAYDAMIEERPYRKAMSKEDAIAEILRMCGTQFDRNMAEIFVNKVLAMEDIK